MLTRQRSTSPAETLEGEFLPRNRVSRRLQFVQMLP